MHMLCVINLCWHSSLRCHPVASRYKTRLHWLQQVRLTTRQAMLKGRFCGVPTCLFDAEPLHVGLQGTCQQLEKSYFRLTSAPDPSVVRPPTVLRRALDRLLRLLRDGAVQYFYAVDQFKGMRQVLQAWLHCPPVCT